MKAKELIQKLTLGPDFDLRFEVVEYEGNGTKSAVVNFVDAEPRGKSMVVRVTRGDVRDVARGQFQ